MTVTKAVYQGKGRVEATHVRSAITIKTDAGKAVGGLGENQNPVELLGNGGARRRYGGFRCYTYSNHLPPEGFI